MNETSEEIGKELMKRAKINVQKKHELFINVIIYIVANIMLTIIWFITDILQIQEIQKVVQQNIRRYDYPEWTLPEPDGFMSAKTYYESKAFPLIVKFKDTIKKMVAQLTVLEEKIKFLTEDVTWYKAKVKKLVVELFDKDKQIEKLHEKADVFDRVKRHAGTDQVDKMIGIERQRDGFYSCKRIQAQIRKENCHG